MKKMIKKRIDKEKVLVVAQEIHFAKALAANDKQLRERALRRLNKWLCMKSKSCLDFTEEGFMRIWKGLFYCVWMSDKPLIQEDTVESISQLLHCFIKFEDSLKFMRCFHQSISQAWFGLGQHRLDKYMMLVRRFTRQSFSVLKREGWDLDRLREFAEDFHKALLVAPVGLIMHLADVYIVELSKVGKGKLTSEVVVELVRPWAKLLASQSDIRIINAVKSHVFLYLIRQTDLAIKHSIKLESWKNCGFPGGDIDMMEEVEVESDEEESGAECDSGSDEEETGAAEGYSDGEEGQTGLDPRAGRVDTILPPVEFDPQDIVSLLHSTKTSREEPLPSRQRKSINILIDKFKALERGKYPLGLRRVEKIEHDSEDEVEEAVKRLSNLEDNLYLKSGGTVSGRKRKLFSIKEDIMRWKSGTPSSAIVWDVEKSPRKGDITLKLSPHSPATSWTVDDISKDEAADEHINTASPSKRRKGKNNGNKSQGEVSQTPEGHFSASSNESQTAVTPEEVRNGTSAGSTPFHSGNWKRVKGKLHKNNELEIEITPNKMSPPKLSGKFKTSNNKKTGTPSSEKKVAFVLSKNQAQEAEEYMRSVENSPVIPYDASKKPLQGVLKSTSLISPINPFYKRKLHKKKSF